MDQKFEILNVKVSVINLLEASQRIGDWIQQKRKAYVCVVPVSTVMECQDNENYRNVVNAADMATPDGMPVVWYARFYGFKNVSRTYGPDLMLRLCAIGQSSGWKHYFYGATPEVLAQLEFKLKEKFPTIKILGRCAPPFRKEAEMEREEFLEEVNRLQPDILWVGLGSPKQDFWMYKHRDKLDVPVMIGVGAAFDFLSGRKHQAPKWLQKMGLEWLFRLASEPQRLWKRYLIGNTRFVYYLIMNSIRRSSIHDR